MRTRLPGRISISLEREPDASVAAAVESREHHTIVARHPATDRVMGTGSVGVREMYINGAPSRVGYLGQLRLHHRYRPRASLVIAGYQLLRELHKSFGVQLYLTSIAAENAPARRLLERGLPQMPAYRPLDQFVTHVVEPRHFRFPRDRDVRASPATSDLMDEILDCVDRNDRRFQFGQVWRERELIEYTQRAELKLLVATRRGRIVGCLGMWDQSRYKQAVIRGYEPQLERWRRPINFLARMTGRLQLPPIGTRLNLAYLSHLSIDGDDPEVFAALLASACERSSAHLVLGLSARHPLVHAVPSRLRHQTYRTNLYAVHWPDGCRAFDALDGRPCQPEVALL